MNMTTQNNTNGIFPIAGTDNPDRKLDILFIHGLGGDAFSTWQYENDEKYFWPKTLFSNFPNTGIWTIGYGATASKWIDDVMPMEDRAENLLNQLILKGIGKKPFMLITHSMGGLISKRILTQAAQSNNTDYQEIANNCKAVVFLAVPHFGSGWSNVLGYAQTLIRGNEILKQLSKDSSSLRQLDKIFSQLIERLNLPCYAFYETKEVRIKTKFLGFIPVSKGIQIVSESSASSSFLKTAVPMDDDHLSICKLRSRSDQLYENIIKIIERLTTVSYKENKDTIPQKNLILDKISNINLSRNQTRLNCLTEQLDAIQTQFDLETRAEERIRIEALIQKKQNDIDELHQKMGL